VKPASRNTSTAASPACPRLSTTARAKPQSAASPGYLAGAPALEAPSDLARHRLLLFTICAFRGRWLCRDAAGSVHEVPVQGDILMSPAGALRDAARAGLGIALRPNDLTDPLIRDGALVHCLQGWDVTATSFDTGAWLVYPSRAFLPAKTRAMIDFLRTELRRADIPARPQSRAAPDADSLLLKPLNSLVPPCARGRTPLDPPGPLQ
jgi:DNA-binding transcriptional LysR family regulator